MHDIAPFVVLFLQVALLFLSGAFIVIALVHIISDAITDVPFVRTNRRSFAKITEALDIRSGDIVYELGSGDGRFLLWAARRFPEARFIGIELNPALVRYAAWRARRTGNPSNIEYRCADLFETDLRDATKIYSYLLTPIMNKLLPKLEVELKNVRLASCAFQFQDKKPMRTVRLSEKRGYHGEETLYVYEF
ncbi:MAG: class I SAM-dependent methyltransferase [Candidatus Kaiserbacteria bacterium]|nr:class I SAM-dependent methyltransferase [Candidatus Kaiserbacteria bacterium]